MLPGGVPLTLLRIPGGTFMMGAYAGERGAEADEAPQHEVTLHDYYLGKYEVTQEQFQAVMGSNPSQFSACGGTCPVERVTWHEAASFVTALNQLFGTTGFRLPTEAEWERAARAGTTTRFSYGDVLDCDDQCGACTAHDQSMWWCGNSGNQTHPIGQKQPNAYDLYDMHGDVWEWVNDWYGTYPSSPQTDPPGPPTGSLRVHRGGSWVNYVTGCRSADRGSNSPDLRNQAIGFRVARTP